MDSVTNRASPRNNSEEKPQYFLRTKPAQFWGGHLKSNVLYSWEGGRPKVLSSQKQKRLTVYPNFNETTHGFRVTSSVHDPPHMTRTVPASFYLALDTVKWVPRRASHYSQKMRRVPSRARATRACDESNHEIQRDKSSSSSFSCISTIQRDGSQKSRGTDFFLTEWADNTR